MNWIADALKAVLLVDGGIILIGILILVMIPIIGRIINTIKKKRK